MGKPKPGGKKDMRLRRNRLAAGLARPKRRKRRR